MKKYFLIVTLITLVLNFSCTEKPNIDGTVAEKMANEWWAELKLDGDNVYGAGAYGHILTYNTSANTNEVWIDDPNQLWNFKVKANADFAKLTFAASQSKSVVANYPITVNITGGKILTDSGHSKTGNITDSIYMNVEFSDDPGVIYTIEGHARTRFSEDEY